MAHNFYVGDLGFHKVVNDDHPYERATAPFRKEQFDTSQTVGDQSLAGWWTRGQLSFHKGAGVEYYEVLDGEEVLNRYRDSFGVDTLSTPGEATLHRAYTPWFTIPLIDADPSGSSQARQIYKGRTFYLLAGSASTKKRIFDIGDPYTVSPPPSLTHATATAKPQTICGDGGNYFYVSTYDTAASPPYRIEKWSELSGSAVLSGEIYTHTGRIAGMWYAKGRLWIVTNEGELFVESPDPTTPPVALSNQVGTLTANGLLASASLTESPTGVYIATGTRVYYVTVGDDGSGVPVIATPVQVAETPKNVGQIQYHLGHVVMGNRVAVVQADGSLVFGPELFTQALEGSQVATGGEFVYLTAGDGSEVRLNRINLAQQIGSSLEFAWETVATFPSATTSGIAFHGEEVQFLFADDDIYTPTSWIGLGSTAAQNGGLTTGFHRMGTLDEKHFHEVVVRTKPSPAGSVYVYRLDPDGVFTYLGVMAAADGVGRFSLGLSAPVERIALYFLLTPEASGSANGPVLLGYQLKALPSPKRQRLIRVPLMMFDIERGPTGRAVGKEKDAWTRYQALEAMEESDALVTFEDKDTGETGTAYIESVELVQRNGSKGVNRANGFGGIVSLTLRKVA